uniref:F-box domain-containing protein n=1 Tax=Corethron hystrix TaxID=216773 RepID=A0A7S1B4K0_9STRA|mmetsp:Transcript_12774/g.28187  ORF Transcript_12774/g.28187 Transcript_12774/m.28187 type:complete len:213 (+) Transcript_12774:112-750(+)
MIASDHLKQIILNEEEMNAKNFHQQQEREEKNQLESDNSTKKPMEPSNCQAIVSYGTLPMQVNKSYDADFLGHVLNEICIHDSTYERGHDSAISKHMSHQEPSESTFSNALTLIGDVTPCILSYCDAPALCNAACVSQTWNAVANSDEMWEVLCRHRFGISSSEVLPPPDPTKMLYILAYKQLKDVFRNSMDSHCFFRNSYFTQNIQFLPRF